MVQQWEISKKVCVVTARVPCACLLVCQGPHAHSSFAQLADRMIRESGNDVAKACKVNFITTLKRVTAFTHNTPPTQSLLERGPLSDKAFLPKGTTY
jgi:hypothetical protein